MYTVLKLGRQLKYTVLSVNFAKCLPILYCDPLNVGPGHVVYEKYHLSNIH